MPGGVEDWGDKIVTAGKAAGAGLVLLTAYRLFVFVCNFLAGRHDHRQDRLDEREARLDGSLANRLSHLESETENSRKRIAALETQVDEYRKVIIVLATEIRIVAPENAKLAEIDRLMRTTFPIHTEIPADMADLLRRAK